MSRFRVLASSWPSSSWLQWFDRRLGLYLVTLALLDGLKWRGAYDLRDFLGAGHEVAAGGSAYAYVLRAGTDTWGHLDIYVSPPFLAHALAPVSGLPIDVVFWAWTFLGVASLFVALRLVDPSLLAPRAPRILFGLAYVWASVGLGQVNLFVLAGSMLALGGRSDRARGIGLAVATLLRVTPLVFAVVLVHDRRWRALLWAAAVTAVAVALTDPAEWIAFGGVLARLAGTGPVDLFPQAALAGWAPALRPIAALAIVLVVLLGRRLGEDAPLVVSLAAGLSILLLPGNSWVHWTSFAIVGLLLWGDRALWSRRALLAFVAASFILDGWVSGLVAFVTLGWLVVRVLRGPARLVPEDGLEVRPMGRTADILAPP